MSSHSTLRWTVSGENLTEKDHSPALRLHGEKFSSRFTNSFMEGAFVNCAHPCFLTVVTIPGVWKCVKRVFERINIHSHFITK